MATNELLKGNLVKSSFWYALANFFLKGVNFISIPIFVRMMSVTQYGIINNFTAWTMICTFFIGLNLNASIANAKFEFKDNIQAFMSSVLTLGMVAGTIILLGFCASYNLYQHLIGLKLGIVLCILIQSFSVFVVNFESAYYMINNQYFKNIFLGFTSTIANFGVSFIFMVTFFRNKVELGRIYGSTIGLAVLAVLLSIKILHRGRKFVVFKYWVYALKLSVPIIPHSLGNILLSQFDRMMISNSVSNEAAGIYSFVYNISTVINVLWLSINNAWVPWFYDHMVKGKYNEIKKAMGTFTGVFTLLCIFSINILIDMGNFMGSKEYLVGMRLLIPVTLGYFFMFLYGYSVNTEFFYKNTIYIGSITILSAFLNIIINLIWIPKYGYTAGAYSTLLTFLFQFGCHSYMGRKIEKDRRVNIFSYTDFGLYSIIMILYSLLLYCVFERVLIRYLLMGVFVGFTTFLIIVRHRRQYAK